MIKNAVERRAHTKNGIRKDRNVAFCAFIGFLAACAIFVILIFVSAAVALKNDDPNALCRMLGIFTIAAALFGGGLAAASASAHDKISSAALCGVIFTLAAATVRVIVGIDSDSQNFSLVFFAFPLVSISAAFVSELIGKSTKKNKRKKTKFERK